MQRSIYLNKKGEIVLHEIGDISEFFACNAVNGSAYNMSILSKNFSCQDAELVRQHVVAYYASLLFSQKEAITVEHCNPNTSEVFGEPTSIKGSFVAWIGVDTFVRISFEINGEETTLQIGNRMNYDETYAEDSEIFAADMWDMQYMEESVKMALKVIYC